ncbi:hypothetical protein GALL_331870 [mine drainage metagenome]|uniref:Uncharacterized protein n=1 Tax=mine drainage metagenome TaxID=410659 RepID=A0A1J5QNN8_9ZZZZ
MVDGTPARTNVTPILHSTITCPHCGHAETETMPTNACQWFYECEARKAMARCKSPHLARKENPARWSGE